MQAPHPDSHSLETAQPRVPTLRMAMAAGVAVASIYYNQPMLALVARELPGHGVEGWIPSITQLGYALGLVMVVPLGDLWERRRLVVAQFGLLALALALTAAAPGVGLLVLASALLGASATVAQQIVPFAAHLAPPTRRGAAVGMVMAGLLSGILLSRTVAGLVSSRLGWRAMFWLAVPLALAMAFTMAFTLPRSPAELRVSYASLLGSLGALWREHAPLRLAAGTQALLFAAFSAFWTTLALRLEQPPFEQGPAAAGAFGVIGLVGVLAAPLAGRLSDKHGPQRLVLLGAGLTVLSWVAFRVSSTLWGIAVGVVLLDFGAQVALVSNQSIIYALAPEARSRLNSLFMAIMFLGGAAGSAASTYAFARSGFAAVALLGITASLLAVVAQALRARPTR